MMTLHQRINPEIDADLSADGMPDAQEGMSNTLNIDDSAHLCTERISDKSLEHQMDTEELNNLFDERFGSFISHVRQSSYDGKLATHQTLQTAGIMAAPFEPLDFISRLHAYLSDKTLAKELDFDDIAWVDQDMRTFYWSREYMSDSYLQMALMGENSDPIEQVAFMTREECRRYDRPLLVATLAHPPFNLTEAQVVDVVEHMRTNDAHSDIAALHASNGDYYLYTTSHLSHAQARALAEYYSVEVPMNP